MELIFVTCVAYERESKGGQEGTVCMTDRCFHCHVAAPTLVCGGCQGAYYCSKACLDAGRATHALYCAAIAPYLAECRAHALRETVRLMGKTGGPQGPRRRSSRQPKRARVQELIPAESLVTLPPELQGMIMASSSLSMGDLLRLRLVHSRLRDVVDVHAIPAFIDAHIKRPWREKRDARLTPPGDPADVDYIHRTLLLYGGVVFIRDVLDPMERTAEGWTRLRHELAFRMAVQALQSLWNAALDDLGIAVHIDPIELGFYGAEITDDGYLKSKSFDVYPLSHDSFPPRIQELRTTLVELFGTGTKLTDGDTDLLVPVFEALLDEYPTDLRVQTAGRNEDGEDEWGAVGYWYPDLPMWGGPGMPRPPLLPGDEGILPFLFDGGPSVPDPRSATLYLNHPLVRARSRPVLTEREPNTVIYDPDGWYYVPTLVEWQT